MLYAAYPRTTAEVKVQVPKVRACKAVTENRRMRPFEKVTGGRYTIARIIDPAGQFESCIILHRVEDGGCCNKELPVGEVPLGLRKIYKFTANESVNSHVFLRFELTGPGRSNYRGHQLAG